jgi:Trk K+ transport system NAD-binding subunit
VSIGDGAVLICGLGALGQACLERLLPFDVPLRAVDLHSPQWRRADLSQRISLVVQGDMRQAQVLERAGVRQCRSVLLLSADSQVNLEAALQVRLLNPDADVVVRSRSGEQSIGQLLEQRLPKVAVVDPLVLTAGAVASAVQPHEGLIQLDTHGEDETISVVSQAEAATALACRRMRVNGGAPSDLWITVRQRGSAVQHAKGSNWWQLPIRILRWQPRWRSLAWQPMSWVAPLVLAAIVLGLALFSGQAGSWQRALLITLGLLQGEFVDPVMLLSQRSLWHLLAGLSYALLGTLLTSALVALILERLLTERLGLRRRDRVKGGSRQVVIVDGPEVVEPIRTLLGSERIGVQTASLSEGMTALDRELERLNNSQVVGIGLLSNHLLSNVHAALALQQKDPTCRLAVLAHAMEASDQLGQMLGGVTVISAVDLAADALVATAFGERVERVLQIKGVNHLVVRYRIEPDDQLCGLTVARVENGYGMTVLRHQRQHRPQARAIPPLDWSLLAGDAITVLATLDSLRRVECGDREPPQWCVELRCQPHPHERFVVQQCLARYLDLAPGQVQGWLDGHWKRSKPLDRDLAELMERELQRLRVQTRLCRADDPSHPGSSHD